MGWDLETQGFTSCAMEGYLKLGGAKLKEEARKEKRAKRKKKGKVKK